eukprot:TRINITY_DN1020_c1_g2_i1.p1 TRINITY_DN1020_c1_g2~~TRINITY_DN1020_c1_g2_i1.p1  ORF type:complete len:319 (+),score=27.44 TRINITY_DN1020_c1_g2_i1:49-957(+)
MRSRFVCVCFLLCIQMASSLQMEGSKLLNGQAEHSRKSILLIGSSVDRYAMNHYCDSVHGIHYTDKKFTLPLDNEKQLVQGCFTENVHMAYIFIPGSAPSPYFKCDEQPNLCGDNSRLSPGMTHATSREIVEIDAPDIAARNFNDSAPDIVMVENSNWDIATWHANEGFGLNGDWPPSMLEKHIQHWSDYDVPSMLELAQKTFPSSKIVTHTPVRPYAEFAAGQTKHAFDMLYSSLLSKVNENGLLYGKYAYVDLYKITADMLLAKESAGIDPLAHESVYTDPIHPGREPSVEYIGQLLEIA